MKRKKNKDFNLYFFFILTFMLLLVFSTIYTLYAISLLSGIENLIRSFLTIIITIIAFLTFYKAYKTFKLNRFIPTIRFVIIVIIYSLLIGTSSLIIDNAYGRIKNISNNYRTYTTSLVTLNNSGINSLEDIKEEKIGMIINKESIAGHQVALDFIKKLKIKNEIIYYDNFIDIINSINKDEIKLAFLPNNYDDLFLDIDTSEFKVIHSHSSKVNIELSKTKINEPFTILLMGIDSIEDEIKNSNFNADSMTLITFNPKTYNSTILSIPKDTYMPISCLSNKENKIAHASWFSDDCVISSIENFIDIDIDYYVKMNFKGLVEIVDILGGINVDVPYNMCEKNSKNKWNSDTIYLEKGFGQIDGEQALALARNIKTNEDECSSLWTNYETNDFIRSQNQQMIIKGIIAKTKEIKNINTLNSIIKSVSNSIETNMPINQILSLYNIIKGALNISNDTKIEFVFGLQKLELSGYNLMINDFNLIDNTGTKLELNNFIPYQGSINDIKNSMKKNLSLIEDERITKMNFNVLLPFQETVIGKNNYDENKILLVPKFIGKHEDEIKAWADINNINVELIYITSYNSEDFVGMIKDQTALPNMEKRYIGDKGFSVKIVEKIEEKELDN